MITVRKVIIEKSPDLNDISIEINDANEWIECMSYNVQCSRLAAGSHDNNIYVYNCT